MKRARFKVTSADGATRDVGIGGKMKTSEGDMIKIGIMGFAGAGKDTTADILWELHSKEKQSVVVSRFAGHLKTIPHQEARLCHGQYGKAQSASAWYTSQCRWSRPPRPNG